MRRPSSSQGRSRSATTPTISSIRKGSLSSSWRIPPGASSTAPLVFPEGEPGLTDDVYDVPFVDGEVLRPHDVYFERCATYVGTARERGLTMLIHPIWHKPWSEALRSLPADYGRYVGRLLADYDNILWSLGGDLRATAEDVAAAGHIARGLVETRPDILRTFHPAGDLRSAPLVHEEPWLDLNMYQVKNHRSGAQYRFAYEDYTLEPTRPTFCGEFAYEYYLEGQKWPPISPLLVRRSAYWSVLAGAMGYTYGRRGVWHFHLTPSYELEGPWYELLDSPGTRHMTEMVNLMRRVEWHKLAPDLERREFAISGVGEGVDITTAALARDGSFGMAYYPEEKSTTFDLGRVTAGDVVHAAWVDPTTGASRDEPGSPFPKGVRTFRPPGKNAFSNADWVLLLSGGRTSDGHAWRWTGTGEDHLPQLVMSRTPDAYWTGTAVDTTAIDADVREFITETGFTGFHVPGIGAYWFDVDSPFAGRLVSGPAPRRGKRLLGFVECSTENAEAIKGLFCDLIERGLRFEEGLLVVVDGGKGLAKATRETFGSFAVLQRCQWHKRENIVGYLNKEDQLTYRSRLQAAYQKTNYREAKAALMEIHTELEGLNRSAARSLMEGLEETLTLHRLGLFSQLGTHLKTTNAIENLNSRLEAYLGKIKHWMTSDQRQRRVALAVLEVELRFKRIDHAQRLPLLRQALRREIGLETEPLSQNNSN